MSSREKPITRSKVDLLASVAVMKYKRGYSQAEIAAILGVSSMTVSRLLDEAVEQGIVKITIKTPIDGDEELSQGLIARYGLNDALIVRNSAYEEVVASVAKATAYYLDLSVCPGDVLGIAAGRTIARVIPHLTLPLIESDKDRFEVVQLQGGYAAMGERNPTNSIINFANRFGIKGHLLHYPMYVSTIELASIIQAHEMRSLEEMWGRCSMLVTGVGTWGPTCVQLEEHLLSDQDFAEFDRLRVVGDLFGRWFDENGDYVDCSCNKRLVSIPPGVQAKIPKRILVASGAEKLNAIHILLKRGMMNILISDDSSAKSLLARS